MDERLSRLFSALEGPLPFEGVFNPWVDVDPHNDIDPACPEIRTAQLTHYLATRLERVRVVMVGEAMGYQGGHFSGIPMTSERILLGGLRWRGIHPEDVLQDLPPRRTSKPTLKPRGFTEPTATIVWETVLRSNCKAMEVAFWNAFAWHPFDPRKGTLSNRKPTSPELRYSAPALKCFLDLFPGATLIAVGVIASEALRDLTPEHHLVRHPAQGGASTFRRQVDEFFRGTI